MSPNVRLYTTYPEPPPGGGGYVPLVGAANKCISLPYQARRQVGHQPKSEGAPATERGRGRSSARSVYNPVMRSTIVRLVFLPYYYDFYCLFFYTD